MAEARIVFDPTQEAQAKARADELVKPKPKVKAVKPKVELEPKKAEGPADQKLHEKDVKEAEKPKAKPEAEPAEKREFINKYGFLHIDRKLAERLGIKLGKSEKNVPVTIEVIEGGFIVKLKV